MDAAHNSERLYNSNENTSRFLTEKTRLLSNTLYNKALDMAYSSDLTGAIDSLQKSLEFDKMNIDARNLLGLCLHASGRIGEAISHWMISLAYQKEDNLADDFMSQLRRDSKGLQKMSDAVRLYNQAFGYLNQSNEDMAVIRLKRAAESSPCFIDALNLLSLCYIHQGHKSKALNAIDKVLEIDAKNPTALLYHAELTSGEKPSHQKKAVGRDEKKRKETRRGSVSGNNAFGGFPISDVVCFFVGALCVAAVFYYMIMPGVSDTLNAEISALKDTHAAQSASFTSDLADKDAIIEQLGAESDEKSAKITELNDVIQLQERVQLVYAAAMYLNQDMYDEALGISSAINTSGFPADVLSLRDSTIYTASTQLETQHYSKGLEDYNAKRYAEAKPNLEAALRYAQADSTTVHNTLYYLGRTSEALGENENAREYYNSIIDNYPDSNQVNNARTRLRNLK